MKDKKNESKKKLRFSWRGRLDSRSRWSNKMEDVEKGLREVNF